MLSHIRALHVQLEDTVASRTRQLRAETNLRLSIEREIAAVSHREQRRIAHELHDGLGQELGALAFQAKLLASRLNRSGNALAKEAQSFVRAVNHSTSRTRALSHLLDPLGESTGALRHALSVLADESGRAFNMACIFEAPQDLPALSTESELSLYRIAQEAIHNAIKHGHATEITIRAGMSDKGLQVTITDNGRGFVPNRLKEHSGNMGLRIMRYRSAALGATLEINSSRGKGCTITCRVPISECTAS
jgi:signal transduction histidine kinase